jgi:hypothetical protein
VGSNTQFITHFSPHFRPLLEEKGSLIFGQQTRGKDASFPARNQGAAQVLGHLFPAFFYLSCSIYSAQLGEQQTQFFIISSLSHSAKM